MTLPLTAFLYGLQIVFGMDPWLQQLRHDLIKRMTWPARDLAALLAEGAAVTPRDVRALRTGLLELRGADGRPTDAAMLWTVLRAEAPARLPPALLDGLQLRIGQAMTLLAAGGGDAELARDAQGLRRIMDSVLSIAACFDALAAADQGPATPGPTSRKR